MDSALPSLAFAQAAYFIVTGVWPILNIRSFMAVTGPKHDLWLVKAVGALVTAVGANIAFAAWQRQINTTVALLAVTSAAALAAVDIIYVVKRVIARVYLLDAVVEIVLIIGGFIFWPRRSG